MRSPFRTIKFIQLSLFPVLLIAYGYYLWQFHVSMLDLAGIVMFIIGTIALTIALIIHFISKRFGWYDKWYANLFTGFISVVIAFGIMAIYARIG